MRILVKLRCVLLLMLLPGLALADSGRILYVSGKVTVERNGKLYRAVPRAKVIAGDKISTAAGGRLHLRMSDNTLISLKPDTDFVIQTYRFAEARDAEDRTRARRPQAAAPEQDGSVFSLLKGGFRAITGLIGQRNKNAFGVNTPVATIGIRGTSFVADLSPLAGGGASAHNQAAGLMLADASGGRQYDFGGGLLLAQAGGSLGGGDDQLLTVGVGEGKVILSNAAGSLLLENGEFGQVRGAGSSPQRITRPIADNEGRGEGTGDDQEGEGRDRGGRNLANRVLSTSGSRGGANKDERRPNQEADGTVIPDPIVGERRDVAVASAISGGGRNTQTTTASITALRQDDNGQITGFITAVDRNNRTVAAAVSLSDGAIVDSGFDPETRLRWGRWSGDAMTLRFRDGSQQQVDPDTVQLHMIASPLHDGEVAIPTTGSREYVLIGNTDPTDASGNIGILGDATLQANFDAQTVQSTLNLSVAEQVWHASGNGLLGSNLSALTPANVFAGQYGNVTVGNSGIGGDGEFSGFFTPGGTGAGLSYQLNHDGNTVNGAAAFGGN